MIAKQYRFHGYSALRFVYSKGKTVRTKGVALRFCKNNHRQDSRLAVVVSKKVAKQAPIRNKIRRRLYETVRLRWALIEPGYDLILTTFDQEVLSMPQAKLDDLIVGLIKKADIARH